MNNLPKPVIRATRGGWLIASKLVKETNKYFHCEDADNKGHTIKVAKNSEDCKVFENPYEALDWIEEDT